MGDYITSQNKDFSRWYTDIVLKAELADYSPVKGCMIIRPYGYAIWENMQKFLDKMLKDTGAKNAYFPLFIPEQYIKKESEHLEGFSPELAVVTIGGGKELNEKLILRPTSETIMYAMYSKWIKSWRDLPIIINQWNNIIRWEMRTRLFLRTTEFLWQEGHSAHSNKDEALEKTLEMLEVYRKFFEEYLAIPVLTGKKSPSQKFAGAVDTFTIEAMMKDKKALQGATSHFLGQNFSKPFNVQFQNINNEQEYIWQTSWGASTRMIGAVVMVHGDNTGLILPPEIAPLQIIIVPIWKNEDERITVFNFSEKVLNLLKSQFRLEIDKREQYKPGRKFNDWEMRGVPLRIEIGPKDVASNSVMCKARTGGQKKEIKVENLLEFLKGELNRIQKEMFRNAKRFLDENVFEIDNYSDFKNIFNNGGGFVRSFWCGNSECEDLIQNDTKATIRCIPIKEDNNASGRCIYCNREAKIRATFAKAY